MPQIGEAVSELHAEVMIQEVDFLDNLVVEKDTKGDFGKPEWDQARPDQYPVLYERKKKVKLKCKFAVTGAPLTTEKVEIRGKATVEGEELEWKCKIKVSPSDTIVETPKMTSKGKLPDTVCHLDPFEIHWEFNPVKEGWAPGGLSANVAYVLYKSPAGVKHYWTLLDISCEGAHGESTEEGVVANAFTPLESTTGDGAGRKRMRDGMQLTYWNMGLNSPKVFTTAELLAEPTGSGRCGSWARMFVDMCKLHGITAPMVMGVKPNATLNAAQHLLVKNHSFMGVGSLAPPYTHVGLTECKPMAGAPGQGKSNPLATFPNHALVIHGKTGIYDPSYGTGPFQSRRLWEDSALDGIGQGSSLTFMSGGDPHYIDQFCSPGFIRHIVAAGETLDAVATQYGVSAGSLFNSRLNSALKTLRGQADKVEAGDAVYIPRIGSNILVLSMM